MSRPGRSIYEEIKARVSCADIAGRYYGVELRRQGREFVGRCPHPAHEDRNPSFYVGPERDVCICRSREGCISG
ncbi:MAG: CHC2 zinc finger domain-containing protein, partial [Actinomycetota bacterium]|nr:CHC2 zinc finger domain-containing protein [Actinomycetota bacterium]